MAFALGFIAGAAAVITGLYVYIRTQMVKPPTK
jgi:hypothetical protein